MQEVVVNKTKTEEIKIVKFEQKFDMPMSILDIDQFKRMNKFQIHNFRYLSDELIPVLTSKQLQKTFVMDLLLLSDGSVHAYVLINDQAKLVTFIQKRTPRDRNEICWRCFHTCSSLNVLNRHQAICYQRDGVQITMPDVDNDQHIFKNINACWYVLCVIYFKLESLILPVSGAEPDPEKSNGLINIKIADMARQSLILKNLKWPSLNWSECRVALRVCYKALKR